MKNFSLKTACWLLSYDYDIIKRSDTWSGRKIKVYAVALILPITTWLCNAYLLTTAILGGSITTGIIAATLSALVIYLIEKVIIISVSETRLIKRVRLVLACSMSVISCFIFKSILFAKDIDRQFAISAIHRDSVIQAGKETLHKGDYARLNKIIENENWQYNDFMDKAKKEAGNPGRPGPGRITRFYIDQARDIQLRQLPAAKTKLDSLNKIVAAEVSAQEKNEDSNIGLLTRINMFIDMTFASPSGIILFIVFFSCFFCLETIVLFLKEGLAESPYEKLEKLAIAMSEPLKTSI